MVDSQFVTNRVFLDVDVRLLDVITNDVYPVTEVGTKFVILLCLQALKNIGLRTSKKIILFNGPLECRFQHYELYRGTRRNES